MQLAQSLRDREQVPSHKNHQGQELVGPSSGTSCLSRKILEAGVSGSEFIRDAVGSKPPRSGTSSLPQDHQGQELVGPSSGTSCLSHKNHQGQELVGPSSGTSPLPHKTTKARSWWDHHREQVPSHHYHSAMEPSSCVHTGLRQRWPTLARSSTKASSISTPRPGPSGIAQKPSVMVSADLSTR